jgi:hypothetical protein
MVLPTKCSTWVSNIGLCTVVVVLGTSAQGQQCQGGDRGPAMAISGSPAPQSVHGEIDAYDDDGNLVVVHPGDNVALTVTSEAAGQGTHNRGTTVYDNTIVEISLWSIKAPTSPPQIGSVGAGAPDDEAPHTGEVVADIGDGTGVPNGAPSYVDGYYNRTWIFKWSSGFFAPVWSAQRTWTIHFFQVIGDYWYSGESQDDWLGGGYSFWSSVLGPYHMLSW